MFRLLLLSLAALGVCASNGMAQNVYKTYREAYSQGVKHLNAGKLADAREPLEAAIGLATTDREKLQVRDALLVPYRELQEIEPYQTASEYIITHNEHAATQSLTRRSMLSFFNKRGKLADAVKGYEERLTKSPDDRVVLFILTEAYGRHLDKPARSAELGEKLIAVEEKLKIKPFTHTHAEIARQMVLAKRYKDGAELFEKVAPLDKTTEAWYYKEAAEAWLKAEDKTKALAAAKKSAEGTPEKRGSLDGHWRSGLGDIYMSLSEPAIAITHYEEALKLAKLEGEQKRLRAKLAEAKASAGK